MERERSETYLNQVKNFLLNYDGGKKKIDFSIKKEMCFLLFKNMTIGPAVGNASPWKRVTFSLFDPFNFLFLESKEKQICQKNQRIIRASAKKSTSVPTDDPWLEMYKLLKPFFYTIFKSELNDPL